MDRMSPRAFSRVALPSIPLGLLLALFVLLSLAGGAARADVWGQTVVRGTAAAALLLAALFFEKPYIGALKPSLLLLLATLALVLLQLVPLPPSLWQALPGRAPFAEVIKGEQPWRPLSIQPNATLNAGMSLLVPFAILIVAGGVRQKERVWVLPILLSLIVLCALSGLVQMSGTVFDNPFINDTPGAVSGLFANRNHFGLALAIGCLLAPVWALQGESAWKMALALGLNILFILLILASGSRSGMFLGVAGTAMGVLITHRRLLRALRRIPRWAQFGIGTVAIGTIVALILISVYAGRAQSIDRALALDVTSDMRIRALPTVTAMTKTYFALGTGFGSFDTLFRMHEPFDLLKPTYFNHAHDDFIEIVLDGGLPALLLLVVGVAWWVVASIRVWRRTTSPEVILGRLGSSMLLFILLASIVDYPARVPMFMAMIVLAAAWLCWGANRQPRSALPGEHPYL
jgi:O-antigen ligase